MTGNPMSAQNFTTRSGKPLEVRQLVIHDIELIQTVFQTEEFAIDDMFLDTVITNPEYGQRVVVALIHERIVGKIRISLNQYDAAAKYAGNVGFLKDLAVVGESRNDGVGSLLIDFAEQIVAQEGLAHTGLRIVCDNSAPLKLCVRKGYNDMFMELPDAFDLYKTIATATPHMTELQVREKAAAIIDFASSLSRAQGMHETFHWR